MMGEHKTLAEREKALFLYVFHDGNMAEVARQAGISRSTLDAWKVKYGWDDKRQAIEERIVEEVRKREGKTLVKKVEGEIARDLGKLETLKKAVFGILAQQSGQTISLHDGFETLMFNIPVRSFEGLIKALLDILKFEYAIKGMPTSRTEHIHVSSTATLEEQAKQSQKELKRLKQELDAEGAYEVIDGEPEEGRSP